MLQICNKKFKKSGRGQQHFTTLCVYMYHRSYYNNNNDKITIKIMWDCECPRRDGLILGVAHWAVWFEFLFVEKVESRSRNPWLVLVYICEVFGSLFHVFIGNWKGGTKVQRKKEWILRNLSCCQRSYESNRKHLEGKMWGELDFFFSLRFSLEKCAGHKTTEMETINKETELWNTTRYVLKF